jgi:hypothetical protein
MNCQLVAAAAAAAAAGLRRPGIAAITFLLLFIW